MRARQGSFWKGTWTVDLEGRPVEMETASFWKGTHRYLVGGTAGRRERLDRRLVAPPHAGRRDALPLHQQVFLLWLELVISRRNTAAAAAGPPQR